MDRLLNVTAGMSIILLVLVLISVRRAHIRVEYSITWLVSAAAMLVLSRQRPLLETLRRWSGLPDTPLTLFLFAGGVFVLSEVLQKATGVRTDHYAQQKLFAPLGITDAQWVYSPMNIPQTGGGLRLTGVS